MPAMNIDANEVTAQSQQQLQERTASWTRYWSSGVLHSCKGSFSGNYEGEIAEYWQAAFFDLNAASRVLDIGTGNGPLPRLLMGLDGGVDRGAYVDAIDLAQLAPNWVSTLATDQRSRLALHSGVRAEQLPFDAAAFDLVVSQYGLEYADQAQSLAEIARVLKPDGSLRVVMHHDDSVVVRMGRIETAQFEFVLAESGLIQAAMRMLPWLAMAATPEGRSRLRVDAEAQAERTAFNQLQARIRSDISAAGEFADLLVLMRDQVQAVMSMTASQGLAATQTQLRQLGDKYREHLVRVRELCTHALSPAQVEQLLSRLQALGFGSTTAVALHFQSRLMGWGISADRV